MWENRLAEWLMGVTAKIGDVWEGTWKKANLRWLLVPGEPGQEQLQSSNALLQLEHLYDHQYR